jgi:eukaryotic-like serine/threonine-protein kinase
MLVGKELGPFRIETELGSGAMGTVYGAVHRDTGKHVAIKIIALGLLGNEKAVERFEREAEILKQLKHPNIVRFIGTGSYKKTPFFVMEYVEGESLDKLLTRRGAFPWDEVVVLGRQLCSALQHAHNKGVIHRDLKPSNLMILRDGTLKLTDFGIAKGADLTALTGTNCTVGTAAYMSPEQCKGEKTLTAKSDLYSMGVVFYELLTGRKPFQAESPIGMFEAHVYSAFERPSRFVMDIPVWLDNLVCHLLEKKPDQRPYDAEMVAKVLDEVQQKVADLRSAGLDVATARTTDRGAKRAADETDRDAARTLRSAVAKKKLRRKTVPFVERKWVHAVLLSSALVGLGGIVYAFTRPPSVEKLYSAARSAVETKDDDALAATDRYLQFYGGRTDEQSEEVRGWNRQLRIDRRQIQLLNRVLSKKHFPPDGEFQKLAYKAIKLENEGDVREARIIWQELAKTAKDDDSEARIYRGVATKSIAQLDGLNGLEMQLEKAVESQHTLLPPDAPEEPDLVIRQSIEARRFQDFGDAERARDRWERIGTDDNLRDPATRPCAVLAAREARNLKQKNSAPDKETDRAKLLADKFAIADAVTPMSDPSGTKTAVSICRDLIALYGQDDDPQIRAFAEKASKKLAALGRK